MWAEAFDMASAIFQCVVTVTHDGIATLRRSFRVVRGAVIRSQLQWEPIASGRGRRSTPFVSRASSSSVALLVFFPAAAGAWIVAADFCVTSVNSGLRCDWFFSSIEDERWLGA